VAGDGAVHPSLVVTARGGGKSRRVVFGNSSVVDGTNVLQARVDGVNATFTVEASRVKAFLDRF
jgi:hypothetical protein